MTDDADAVTTTAVAAAADDDDWRSKDHSKFC